MSRGQLSNLILEFIARGGEIRRVPERVVTVDWAETGESRFLKHMRELGRRGRETRWGKAA